MAQYQHLPIYKATYDLLARVTQVTAGFSKAYKHSLGDRLRDEVVDMVVFIFKANSSIFAPVSRRSALSWATEADAASHRFNNSS